MIPDTHPREWNGAAVVRWLQDTAKRYAVGQVLAPDDLAVYEQILERHPNAEAKRGPGIEYVRIDENSGGHKAYTIVQTDGTVEVAGQKTLASKQSRSLMDRLRAACRSAACASTVAYKDDHFGESCALCGALWKSPREMPVDHAPPWPFDRVFLAWCEVSELTEKKIEPEDFTQRTHGQIHFAERAVAENFLAFHDKRATLRLLCKDCNSKG